VLTDSYRGIALSGSNATPPGIIQLGGVVRFGGLNRRMACFGQYQPAATCGPFSDLDRREGLKGPVPELGTGLFCQRNDNGGGPNSVELRSSVRQFPSPVVVSTHSKTRGRVKKYIDSGLVRHSARVDSKEVGAGPLQLQVA